MMKISPSSEWRPIRWTNSNPFSNDAALLEILCPENRRLWGDLQELQDQRGDVGHARIVTAFTDCLARIAAYPALGHEAAVAAAILHDAGYALVDVRSYGIEGCGTVNQLFREILRLRGALIHLPTEDERAEGKRLDRLIRSQHQAFAVELARKHLAAGPLQEEVVAIVTDHDTRDHQPSRFAPAMWDADILSRLTPAAYESYRQERTGELLYQSMLHESHHSRYLLPDSPRIARIELANTIRFLLAPAEWPQSFSSRFSDELRLQE